LFIIKRDTERTRAWKITAETQTQKKEGRAEYVLGRITGSQKNLLLSLLKKKIDVYASKAQS